MTDTPVIPLPPILLPPELEYVVVPASALSGGGEEPSENGLPLIWQELKYIDIEDTVAGEGVQLMGHVVKCRMYQIIITYDEEGEEIRTKTQVPYQITQSQLTIDSPEPPLFIGQIDPPEQPTTLFGAELRSYAAGEWAVAGIRDESTYDYYKVFDQAEVSWLPRASTIEQDYIEPGEHGLHYPYEPEIDENRPRPKYTMDTISAWVPDPREVVEVKYKLVTNGQSVTITHPVYQDMDNMTEKLRRVLNRCYFTHGLYHNSLYLNEADNNYNESGAIRGNPVEIFDVDDFLVRTESFDDDGELISIVREPIYPLEGDLTPIVDTNQRSNTYGQLISVAINNPGALYPKGFILKFKNTSWLTAEGEAPLARAIVSPIVREEPQRFPRREGRLTGGQIIRIEIINPGSGMRSIGSIEMKTTSLSNTRYDYGEGFISNRSLESIIPIEERTQDD